MCPNLLLELLTKTSILHCQFIVIAEKSSRDLMAGLIGGIIVDDDIAIRRSVVRHAPPILL